MKNNLQEIFSTLLIILLLNQCINASPVESEGANRPLIKDNTLVAADGARLRGGTFWLYGWIPDKTTWALSNDVWNAIKDYQLNVIRVACAYRPEQTKNYSLDKYRELLDNIIERSANLGVYVIIDFHPQPGSYNMDVAREFWTNIAPRYKENKNVIYELINEPKFSQPENYTDQNLRDFEELWKLVNNLAPKTPVIVMSFCQVGNTGRTPKQVTDQMSGIDWGKTIVGFHSYWRDSGVRIIELKKHYPCINTEFHDIREGSKEMQVMDGNKWHGTLMEIYGISWTQWDILDRRSSLVTLDSAITDLKKKGLYWGK